MSNYHSRWFVTDCRHRQPGRFEHAAQKGTDTEHKTAKKHEKKKGRARQMPNMSDFQAELQRNSTWRATKTRVSCTLCTWHGIHMDCQTCCGYECYNCTECEGCLAAERSLFPTSGAYLEFSKPVSQKQVSAKVVCRNVPGENKDSLHAFGAFVSLFSLRN